MGAAIDPASDGLGVIVGPAGATLLTRPELLVRLCDVLRLAVSEHRPSGSSGGRADGWRGVTVCPAQIRDLGLPAILDAVSAAPDLAAMMGGAAVARRRTNSDPIPSGSERRRPEDSRVSAGRDARR